MSKPLRHSIYAFIIGFPIAAMAAPGENLNGQDLTLGDTVSIDYSSSTGADSTWTNGGFVNTIFSTQTNPAKLDGTDFTDSNLTGAKLEQANLTGADLTGSTLDHAVFKNADISGASTLGASFYAVDFDGVTGLTFSMLSNSTDVRGIKLNNLSFAGANISNVAQRSSEDVYRGDLSTADLSFTNFTSADFSEDTLSVNLASARLVSTDFTSADLSGVNFGSILNVVDPTRSLDGAVGADITNAVFTDAVLKDASFDGVIGFSVNQLSDVDSAMGIKLTNLDLTGLDFRGVAGSGSSSTNQDDLSGASFQRSTLTGAIFSGMTLSNANFHEVSMENADLSSATLDGANLSYSDASNADFSQSDLSGASLRRSTVDGADFSQANLSNADLASASAVGTNFSGADLTDASAESLDANTADFSQATLANFSAKSADMSGANLTSADLTGANLSSADLTGATLADTNLNGATLSKAVGLSASDLNSVADARGIEWVGSDLSGQNFTQVASLGTDTSNQLDLTAANFASSDLSNSILDGVNLTDAWLSNTDLIGASLNNTDLTGGYMYLADFQGADLTGSVLTNANISHANLDSVTTLTFSQLSGVRALSGARLTNLNMSGWDFSQFATSTSLRYVSFANSDVNGAIFTDKYLNYANFDNATGFQASQLDDVLSVRYIQLSNLDLAGQDFSQVASLGAFNSDANDLSNASFAGSDVTGTIFTNADLFRASFDGATGLNASQLNDVQSVIGINLSNTNLAGNDFTQVATPGDVGNLNGAQFVGTTLSTANFTGVSLEDANFASADVTGANFKDVDFTDDSGEGSGASFDSAIGFDLGQLDDVYDARYIGLTNLDFIGKDFTSVATTGADSTYAINLTGVQFDGSNLTNAVFTNVALYATTFDGANLSGVDFTNAGLLGASFVGAQNFDASLLTNAFDVRGVDFSGLDVSGQNFTQVATGGAATHGKDLIGANFTDVTLDGADFSGVSVNSGEFLGASAVGANFTGADLRIAKLGSDRYDKTSADFSGANLTNAQLNAANMIGTNLDGATLSGADLKDASLQDASLDAVIGFAASQLDDAFNAKGIQITNSILSGQDFSQVASLGSETDHARNLQGASFAGSTLDGAGFEGLNLNSASFDGADLSGASFKDATLRNASFDSATARGASFNGAVIYASFTGVDLSGSNFGSADLGGSFVGGDLSNAMFNGADLSYFRIDGAANFTVSQLYNANDVTGIKLLNMDLSGGDFTRVTESGYDDEMETGYLLFSSFAGSILSNTNFSGTQLARASFQGADLTNADLSSVVLSYATLAGANLTGTDLSGAYLRGTSFLGADVTSADFTGADLIGANFGNVVGFDLSILSSASTGGLKLTGFDGLDGRGTFAGADFSSVGSLSGVVFNGSDITNADFTDISLYETNFSGAIGFSFSQLLTASSVRGVSLSGMDLNGVDFRQVASLGAITSNAGDLSGASLRSADITSAVFDDVNLNGTDFSQSTGLEIAHLNKAKDVRAVKLGGLDMSGWDLSNVASAGAITSNAGDLSNARFWGANVTNAIFTDTNLSDASFGGANVTNASFTDADLNGVSFSGSVGFDVSQLYDVADARGISFASMDLRGADFTKVATLGTDTSNARDLSGANFRGSKLDNATFESVNLTGADFTWATLANTTFTNASVKDATFYKARVESISVANRSSLSVRSSLTVNGTFTVGAGSTFAMEGEGVNTLLAPVFDLSPGALFELNQHRLKTLTFNGDFSNAAGIYAPGTSPAASAINGNYNQGGTATLELEIAGLTAGELYDTVAISGDATIDGTVEVILLDGFNLADAVGTTFDFLNVTGTLLVDAGVEYILPWMQYEGVIWDTSNFGTDGTMTLTAVPEPTAFALIAGLLALSLATRRRARNG